MGAPAGNKNSIRHGLTTGSLPPGSSYVVKITNLMRISLESMVIEAKGEIGLVDAAAINTACRWERHALLAQRWLRLGFDTMEPDQRLTFSREIARASSKRDKCFRSLDLEPVSSDDKFQFPVIDIEPDQTEDLPAAGPTEPQTTTPDTTDSTPSEANQ